MMKRMQNIESAMQGVEIQIKEIDNKQYLEFATLEVTTSLKEKGLTVIARTN